MTDVALEDYSRMEIAFAAYLDAHPEETRADSYMKFKAGWVARVNAARTSLGSYSVDGSDAVMYETMRLLEEHIRHLDRLVFSNWRVGNERAREIEKLRLMIRESGGDPDDAPLWRRISEQRKEIRRLSRLVASQNSPEEGVTPV
jgi:hypothetical protein